MKRTSVKVSTVLVGRRAVELRQRELMVELVWSVGSTSDTINNSD